MLSPASTDHESHSWGDYSVFLRRAAHDPRFRASLEADAQAALADYGLSVDPEQIPTRVTIPSPESILDILNDESSDTSDSADVFRWQPLFL